MDNTMNVVIEDINNWPCDTCNAIMELLSCESKIFWCPKCGTISKGFPTSTWKIPENVDD